jgi:hypothetical protein
LQVAKDRQYYPFRAAFDFECMFTDNPDKKVDTKLTFDATLEAVSVSVNSNVSGLSKDGVEFDRAHCIVSTGSQDDLIERLCVYLNDVSDRAYELMRDEYQDIRDELEERAEADVDAADNSKKAKVRRRSHPVRVL